MAAPIETSERILDVAERLIQTVGFNGFSYADIAAEMSITKASLHYHFATKGELGVRLIERYQVNFLAALEDIERQEPDAQRRLSDYTRLYAGVLRKNRMCLCGMLAADFATLPKPMRERVRAFFDANEVWLTRVLEQGKKRGELRFFGTAEELAQSIVSWLEGAMMVARSYGEPARFDASAERMLASVTPGKDARG